MRKLLQQLRERYARLRAPHEPADGIDEAPRVKPAATLAAVLLLVVLALWVVWAVPHRVVQRRIDAQHPLTLDKQLDLEDAYRKTITQIVLSVFGLYILYLSARRAETADKTVRIMEQGHITDRFTKAIEQLGKTDGTTPNIEVRLGAIYALERIALDSPRDHWTIMEVLTAYVRQNAPLDPDRPYTEGEKPRTDIQAILTVLGRRRTGPKRERSGQRLDLTKSRLCGSDLWEANLKGADLYEANLTMARLWKANLQNAYLGYADLQGANLNGVNLQNAVLKKANLLAALLRGANLQYADLNEANLYSADLYEANLQWATLIFADLAHATPLSANLQNADLAHANLQGSTLRMALLEGVKLREADIDNADLREASGVTVEQIKSAKAWQTAHYSPNFRAELGLPPEPTEDPTLPL